MAKKDPALLWYWNDWQGGTSTFTRHLKGCYMDLLNAQFNSGRLSLAEIKTILGADFGPSWPTLQKKFSEDESGFYFNQRMEEEKEKRKNFTESRRKNLSTRKEVHMDTHMSPHMEPHMDNVNKDENVIKDRGSGKGWNKKPSELEMDLLLPDIKSGAVIQHFRISKNVDITILQVQGLWSVFKVQNFTGERFYASANQVYSHFINWCKGQEIKEVIFNGITPPQISIREQKASELLNSIE